MARISASGALIIGAVIGAIVLANGGGDGSGNTGAGGSGVKITVPKVKNHGPDIQTKRTATVKIMAVNSTTANVLLNSYNVSLGIGSPAIHAFLEANQYKKVRVTFEHGTITSVG